MPLTTAYFLVALGALQLLGLAAAAAECFGSSDRCFSLLHLSVSRLCAFFLFARGLLAHRTVDQRVAAGVIAYETLSVVYMYHVNKAGLLMLYGVGWTNACACSVTLASHAYTSKKVAWRGYKRLFSSKTDLFFYHVRTLCSVFLFATQFFSFVYVFAGASMVIRVLSGLFLYMVILGVDKSILSKTCYALFAASFIEMLFSLHLSSVSVFVFAAASSVCLAIDLRFKWSPRASAPCRVGIGDRGE